MDAFRWEAASTEDCERQGALLIGRDIDGAAIYAGRAYHEGDLIPAKVIPSKNVAYIPYNGEEIVVDQFEILVKNNIRWVWAIDGGVPPGAVVVGQTVEGEPLFYGRVHRNGAIIPGKVHPSHGSCYYPFDGQEMPSKEYEVLVID